MSIESVMPSNHLILYWPPEGPLESLPSGSWLLTSIEAALPLKKQLLLFLL